MLIHSVTACNLGIVFSCDSIRSIDDDQNWIEKLVEDSEEFIIFATDFHLWDLREICIFLFKISKKSEVIKYFVRLQKQSQKFSSFWI